VPVAPLGLDGKEELPRLDKARIEAEGVEDGRRDRAVQPPSVAASNRR
jgi:hypothetical protein